MNKNQFYLISIIAICLMQLNYVSPYLQGCKTLSLTENNCMECYPGYYLTSSATCDLCSNTLGNCFSCAYTDTSLTTLRCLSCKTGYALGASGSCVLCHSSCQTCYGTAYSQCLTCKDGYYKYETSATTQTFECLSCDGGNLQGGAATGAGYTGCSSITTTGTAGAAYSFGSVTCATTHGYVLNTATTKCASCTANTNSMCTSCTYTAAVVGPPAVAAFFTCTACQTYSSTGTLTGYYLSGSSCINSCSVRNCKTCSSSSTCAECQPGSQLVSGACTLQSTLCTVLNCNTCSTAGLCTACNSGYYLSTTNTLTGDTTPTCIQCPSNCNTCTNGKICSKCDGGYMLSKDGLRCYACTDKNCKTCTENAYSPDQYANVCTECNTPYILSADNQCIYCFQPFGTYTKTAVQCNGASNFAKLNMRCQIGFYNQLGTCTACPIYCELCSSASRCQKCTDGYYINNDGYCQRSQQISQSSCSDTNCQMCISGDPNTQNNVAGKNERCLKCKDNYYSPYGSGDKCVKCSDANCLVCMLNQYTTGIPVLQCVHCAKGYYLKDNVCTKCTTCQNQCTFYGSTNVEVCYQLKSFDVRMHNELMNGATTHDNCKTYFRIDPLSNGDTYGQCNECNDGWLWEAIALQGGSCVKRCDPNCRTCAGAQNKCTNCNQGFYISHQSDTSICIPANRDAIIIGAILGAAFLVTLIIAVLLCMRKPGK